MQMHRENRRLAAALAALAAASLLARFVPRFLTANGSSLLLINLCTLWVMS